MQPTASTAAEPALAGRVALVTGASSGIGRATAQLFAREGARVVAVARSVEGGSETVRTIQAAGGEAIFVRTDVTRSDDLRAAVAAALDAYGKLDVAVNNAGAQATAAPVADQTEEDFDAIMAVNLRGVWLSMKHEIPAMLAAGGGAIVNVASVGGVVAAPGIAPYVASKHAVIGLTKAAALDYANAGIRINALAPGATRTAIWEAWLPTPEEQEAVASLAPLRRVAEPEEIAPAALWLCSQASSFVTGATIVVDGGYSVP